MAKIKPDPKYRAEVCLDYIKIFVKTKDPDVSLLRDLVDDWFKYKKGGLFLNKQSGRPVWFNNPMRYPGKTQDRMIAGMKEMHFISKDARAVLDTKSGPRLVVDHAVPVKKVHEILLENPRASKGEIEKMLRQLYKFGVITKNEDNRLNKSGLRSKMPDDWKLDNGVFARYEEADIDGRINLRA